MCWFSFIFGEDIGFVLILFFVFKYQAMGMEEERMEFFFNLTMNSTHFYLWLYCVRQMVMDQSNNEKRNPQWPFLGLLFDMCNR